MNKISILLLLAFFAASCTKSSSLSSPTSAGHEINFEKSFSIASSYDGKTGKLKIHVGLAPGVHAYGDGEKIGMPVKLKISPAGNWKLIGSPVIPKGQIKDLGALGKSVVIDQSFVVEATVKNGTGAIIGELDLQICSDSACDRPRNHGIKVDVSGN